MATIVLAVLAAILICCLPLLKVGQRPKGLPPGPPTLPIIGHMHLVCINDSILGTIMLNITDAFSGCTSTVRGLGARVRSCLFLDIWYQDHDRIEQP